MFPVLLLVVTTTKIVSEWYSQTIGAVVFTFDGLAYVATVVSVVLYGREENDLTERILTRLGISLPEQKSQG